MNNKQEAEFYRVGLDLGLFTLAEVIEWCDREIMTQDTPDDAIIEASLSGSQGRYLVSRALLNVQGEVDKQALSQHFLRWLLEIVTQDRAEAPRVAYLLSELESEGYGTGVEEIGFDSYSLLFEVATDPDIYNPRDIERLTNELIAYLNELLR